MVTKKTTITNKAGIHCRPSSRIMQKVMEYPDCTFKIESTKGEADLTGILSLMSLGLECGEEVKITVDGPNEENICEELVELFSFDFDFPPRI
ncbi:MAG TPA: HPr family phosphocarrier protein [Victivallales bacterium]|nr:HPr family phosphocarrier protein [Victivallales bacterium]